MAADHTLERVSLRRLRWSARIPRIAGGILLCILALAGLRGIVAPPRPVVPPAPKPAPQDVALEGFAVEFARAYLTYDPNVPEARQAALRPFIAAGNLGEDGGVSLPSAASTSAQNVVGAHAVQVQETADGSAKIVTVAVDLDVRQTPLFLAVTVRRDGGALHLTDYPALVGGPLASSNADPPEREEVDNPQIATLARRAISNYLSNDLTNLRGDLARDAVITLPGQTLRVRDIPAVEWATANRSAVQATVIVADQSGGEWTFSYELGVRQEVGDWRIAWIQSLATET